jgi:hypothetical protein
MTRLEYWRECIESAAEECALALTEQQTGGLTPANQFEGHDTWPPQSLFTSMTRPKRA